MNSAYLESVRSTYIENWSDDLARLSIAQVGIRLAPDVAWALYECARPASRNAAQALARLDPLAIAIDAALERFPRGGFVRLGSRSAKDSHHAQARGLRITSGQDALRMLTTGSHRTAFDLRLALAHDYAPHVFVREWHEIPTWSEFRCFMRDRALVGISQYDCVNLGHSPDIARHAAAIRRAIEAFFINFRSACQLVDVVFDVFVAFGDDESDASVTLLELNPFLPATDACLFSWAETTDMDGTFRFLPADTGLPATTGASSDEDSPD